MKISRETWLLGLFCTFDMLLTAWLLSKGMAQEANPIMLYYVQQGILVFILAKTLLFLGPLIVLEVIRMKRPKFVQTLLRMGIASYLLVYGIAVISVNM